MRESETLGDTHRLTVTAPGAGSRISIRHLCAHRIRRAYPGHQRQAPGPPPRAETAGIRPRAAAVHAGLSPRPPPRGRGLPSAKVLPPGGDGLPPPKVTVTARLTGASRWTRT